PTSLVGALGQAKGHGELPVSEYCHVAALVVVLHCHFARQLLETEFENRAWIMIGSVVIQEVGMGGSKIECHSIRAMTEGKGENLAHEGVAVRHIVVEEHRNQHIVEGAVDAVALDVAALKVRLGIFPGG